MRAFVRLSLALCANLSIALAFVRAPVVPARSVALLSTRDTITTGNVGASNRLRTLEKNLEKTLSDLAMRERQLESRLVAIERSAGIESPPGLRDIWENSRITTVQGGSLRTWSFGNPMIRRVHVLLKTDGRPLDANIELWQGPDNTPAKIKLYVEDGQERTFSAFIDTPNCPNTVAVRNTAQMEFPMYAVVGPDYDAGDACLGAIAMMSGDTVQGGALRTYPFDPTVESVAVMLKTDGRPLNARIELLQGPNNNKQVLDLYTEDGLERPFYAVIQTPGTGNVIRVVNQSPVEFPLHATVAPYEIGSFSDYEEQGFVLGHEAW